MFDRSAAPSSTPVRLAARAAACAVVVLAGLWACADPATAPGPRPAASPTAAKAPAASCTAQPVQPLVVTAPSPAAVVVGATATFSVCTQYKSAYTIAANPAGAVSVQSTAPAQQTPDGPYVSTVTVTGTTAGATPVTLTVTDKKGNSRTVQLTVTPPPPSGIIVFSVPSTADAPLQDPYGSPISVDISEKNYSGTFRIAACTKPTGGATCGDVTDLSPPYAQSANCSGPGTVSGSDESIIIRSTYGSLIMEESRTRMFAYHAGALPPVGDPFGCTYVIEDELGNRAEYPVVYTR